MKTHPEDFWSERYKAGHTGWDIGEASPPIVEYVDSLENKNQKILIPGCGNAYEAQYLMEKGFTNVTLIDISQHLVEMLKERFFPDHGENLSILYGDFFDHKGQYDLILEQTFFCALPPKSRPDYVEKMHSLLKPGGKLAGVLFNIHFDHDGPPYGGDIKEYKSLFEKKFDILKMEECYNSIKPRRGNEAFFIAKKPVK